MKLKKLASLALAGALTLGLLPAFSSPALAAEGDTSTYTLAIPSSLNVTGSGWNDAGGISATGTLESGKKLTVTAASANSWALKQQDGSETVGYTMKETSDGAAKNAWEFTTLPGSATLGIDVADYSTKPAGTYTDTVTFTAKVEDAVKVETLLTTLTFGGSSTYSETTSGIVSVTATNVTKYDARYGWLWYDEGSLSVTAKEGYTITKCVFRQNAKNPITDTEAPFEIHSNDRGRITESTNMDGVTSIEVYGYAN